MADHLRLLHLQDKGEIAHGPDAVKQKSVEQTRAGSPVFQRLMRETKALACRDDSDDVANAA